MQVQDPSTRYIFYVHVLSVCAHMTYGAREQHNYVSPNRSKEIGILSIPFFFHFFRFPLFWRKYWICRHKVDCPRDAWDIHMYVYARTGFCWNSLAQSSLLTVFSLSKVESAKYGMGLLLFSNFLSLLPFLLFFVP